MKSIKHVILAGCACAALALFSPTSFAQNILASAPEVGVDHPQPSSPGDIATQSAGNTQSAPQPKHDNKFKKLVQALGLNNQQKAVLKPVLQQSHLQITGIRKNTSLSAGQKQAEIKQIKRSTFAQIKGILTPAQQMKLREIRARAKEHHGQNQQQG